MSIFQKYPSGPVETNAILVVCSETRKAVVIDPSYGSAKPLMQALAKRELQLQGIYLTHSHWDHIVDAHALKEATGAPVYVHRLDAPNVVEPGCDGLPLLMKVQGVQPDGYLEDRMIIALGHLKIEVIHTPGHSPGSVCFYLKEQGVLFSGDTLFCGCMGRVDFATGEPARMRESLAKLSTLPPNTVVVPGHGEDTTIGNESKWMKLR